MYKKMLDHWKNLIGQSRNVSAQPENTKTHAEREATILAAEQAVLGREMAARLCEQAVEHRENLLSDREEAAKSKDEFNTMTEAQLRESNEYLVIATVRAQTITEKMLSAQKESEKAKVAFTLSEEQLREANERLVIATIRAQTMAEAAEQTSARMSYMAEHDFLTGLPNRFLLADRLAQAISLAERHRKRIALLYLDLDHFKHINDSLGHAVGDQVLQLAATRLLGCVRRSDTVSRQGGDEFVILLTEVGEVQGAVNAAEKVIEAMTEPYLIGNHQLHITLSIGISFYPDDAKDVETMARNSDTAMYHAKKNGRNNYQLFTQNMNVHAVARRSTEQALHHALEQHKFVLYYQPKVNLETGTITGAEALLRLRQDDQRLTCPVEFISIAEDCGLIMAIGKWVLREACRQTVAWLQAGLDTGQIAVNVSALEFHNKDFLAGVRTILADTGLNPHYLELELTESGLMQDTEATIVTLYALKDLGVQIAIDDFGTGYSSLSYLRRFPIDTLKIDQSFVQSIDGDTGNAGEAIVNAVIAMGASLKQRVVAEGIETSQQLSFLKTHHCAEGQGYYFGRPMGAEKFAKLLLAARH